MDRIENVMSKRQKIIEVWKITKKRKNRAIIIARINFIEELIDKDWENVRKSAWIR